MSMNGAIEILTAENVAEVRKGIIKLILEQVREDLDASTSYTITADDIYAIAEEAIDEAKAEIKALYSAQLRKMMDEQFRKLSI